MMKRITPFLILLSVYLWSCEKQNCEPNTVTTSFTDQKEIQVSFDTTDLKNRYSIEEGENLVFQHSYYNGHCEGKGDDWYRFTVSFEISPDSTSFDLQDSDLVIANCFVHHKSYWLNEDYPVVKGKIEGEKRSDEEWTINGSVTYTLPLTHPRVRTISFDDIFRK